MAINTSEIDEQKAVLPLSFIVVGAGIAGLGVAYKLSKAGHSVRVLERSQDILAPSAGMVLSPNMSKILRRWAGDDSLDKISRQNLHSPWYDVETGELLEYARFDPKVMAETGGPYVFARRDDIISLLYRLATSTGAEFTFGATVTAVTPGDPKPSITLSSGEVLTADLVIGADGISSTVRKLVYAEETDQPRPNKCAILASIVPSAGWAHIPEWEKYRDHNGWTFTLGRDRAMSGFPLPNGDVSVQLYWPDEDACPDKPSDWTAVLYPKDIVIRNLNPLFSTFVDTFPYFVKGHSTYWPEDLDYRSDKSGRVVLVGEAAHTWFPGAGSPALSLEDAAVFGALFSFIRQPDQIASTIRAYEDLRQQRVRDVEPSDQRIAIACVEPDILRQRMLENKASSDPESDADEESVMRREFDGVSKVFCYDCLDAANEWWQTWGRRVMGNDDVATMDIAVTVQEE